MSGLSCPECGADFDAPCPGTVRSVSSCVWKTGKRKWRVWVEGHAATVDYSHAQYLGTYWASDFSEACRIAHESTGGVRAHGQFKPGDPPTMWGCRCYDNEADARRSFG